MPTISEIAQKANVSRTLVSRVLNNKSGVSPENRERILAVIQECNYVPNALARSLVMQKTQTIGVVMDDLCDNFFFDLISGLQDSGELLGYNVLFCSGRSNMDIKLKYVDYFAHGRTDGVIAYGSNLVDDQLFRNFVVKTPNFVLIEGDLPNTKINNVLLNNFSGAYRATEHLIKMGYHKIIHLTGDMNYKVSLDRLNGFVKAMRDYSIPIEQDTIVYADFDEDMAHEQMNKRILAGNIPDACFAGADKTAFGAIRAMYEHNLTTPGDIAIIGFDGDEPDSRDILFPQLTTMRQPLYDMGFEGMKLLIHIIENPMAEPQTKMFEPEFIIRDTCK